MAMEKLRKRQFTFSTGYLLLAVVVLWAVQAYAVAPGRARVVPYSELLEAIESGRAKEATLRAEDVVVVLRAAEGGKEERIAASRLPGIDETALLQKLRDRGVVFSGRVEDKGLLTTLLFGWVLPFGLMAGLYVLVMRRMGKGVGPLSFGKATPKIHDLSEKNRATFADVAGVDEAKAELVETVGYLKNPEKYRAIGARAPKGVLLVGPPGTGKTLLARAVAGEAGVPFFSISGSEFVQMFVGVGAARVRDLFEQAKERAPCIIFIDELDAIGRSRAGASGGFGVHEEREQTLNQILVEMDGFDSSRGVVILAATNRPEVLDQALLRAGRFDRQVLVDRPDVRGREAILGVHARRLQLGPDVSLAVIAQRTPGMTGADLANVVNEAALAAARREGAVVLGRDFEEAVDRIQLGLRKQGVVMTEEERRRVAFHEAGHALVALELPHADPVHRVTIIPRSIGALGATLQLPVKDRYLVTKGELVDHLCVLLGGRAAEELVFQDASTGAENDLQRATETARQMVCRFGMSEKLGPLTYAPPSSRFLEMPMFGETRSVSEETARLIDQEIRSLIEEQHRRARALLEGRRGVLERIATQLVERETLERAELEALARGETD